MKLTIIKQLFKNMARNKFFTFLNLFGISFAVAIIMIITIKLDNEINPKTPGDNLGRTLIIDKGYYTDSEENSMSASISSSLLEKLFSKIDNVEAKSMYATFSWAVITKSSQLNLKAIYNDIDFWKIHKYGFLEGRAFTKDEFDKKEKVIVISHRLKEIYFGSEKAINEYIEYNNNKYKVIGIIENVNSLCENAYAEAFLPYSLSTNKAFANEFLGNCTGLILAKNKKDFDRIKKQAKDYISAVNKTMLKGEELKISGPYTNFEKKHISFNEEKHSYFNEKYKGKFAVILDYVWKILLALLLPAISLVSLNITRIQERAEEIAVRKAFGADRIKLLKQLFFENIILTLIGGIMGFILSILIVNLLSDELFITRDNFYTYISINYIVFIITLSVTLIFSLMSGLIPALRMSKLQTVNILKGGEL